MKNNWKDPINPGEILAEELDEICYEWQSVCKGSQCSQQPDLSNPQR